MLQTLAIIACAILAGLAGFQLSLILGAPLGKFAWGGAHKVLPASLRVGSGVSIVLYALFAAIILQQAGFIQIISSQIADVAIWVLTVYFFIGVVMNLISRSKSERALMTPVAVVLALSCLYIAMN